MAIDVRLTLSQALDIAEDDYTYPKWLRLIVIDELDRVEPEWRSSDLKQLARAIELRVAGRPTNEGAATSDDLRTAAAYLRLYASDEAAMRRLLVEPIEPPEG